MIINKCICLFYCTLFHHALHFHLSTQTTFWIESTQRRNKKWRRWRQTQNRLKGEITKEKVHSNIYLLQFSVQANRFKAFFFSFVNNSLNFVTLYIYIYIFLLRFFFSVQSYIYASYISVVSKFWRLQLPILSCAKLKYSTCTSYNILMQIIVAYL